MAEKDPGIIVVDDSSDDSDSTKSITIRQDEIPTSQRAPHVVSRSDRRMEKIPTIDDSSASSTPQSSSALPEDSPPATPPTLSTLQTSSIVTAVSHPNASSTANDVSASATAHSMSHTSRRQAKLDESTGWKSGPETPWAEQMSYMELQSQQEEMRRLQRKHAAKRSGGKKAYERKRFGETLSKSSAKKKKSTGTAKAPAPPPAPTPAPAPIPAPAPAPATLPVLQITRNDYPPPPEFLSVLSTDSENGDEDDREEEHSSETKQPTMNRNFGTNSELLKSPLNQVAASQSQKSGSDSAPMKTQDVETAGTKVNNNKKQGTKTQDTKASKSKKNKAEDVAKSTKKRSRMSKAESTPVASKEEDLAPVKTTDKLDYPRNAYSTVLHPTSWRRLRATNCPVNVLPRSSSDRLFLSFTDKPLTAYDTSGQLEQKCRFSLDLPQSSSDLSSTSDESTSTTADEVLSQRVQDILTSERPKVEAYKEKKALAILREERKKTREYLAEVKEFKSRPSVPLDIQHLPALKHDLAIAKRLQHTRRLRPKEDKRIKFMLVTPEMVHEGNKDDGVFLQRPIGKKLPKTKTLSASTSLIGIKHRVRVEDDPVLRHLPYFGDDDEGDHIDLNNYDGVDHDDDEEEGSDGEVSECLVRIVANACGSSDNVMLKVRSLGVPKADVVYQECRKQAERRHRNAQRIQYAKKLMKRHPDWKEVQAGKKLMEAAGLKHLFQDVQVPPVLIKDRLAPLVTEFESNMLRSCDRAVRRGLRVTDQYKQLQTTYRDLFCRICYKYDCSEHGIEHPLPKVRMDPMNPRLKLALVKSEDEEVPKEEVAKEETKEPQVSVEEQENASRRRSARSSTRASSLATVQFEKYEKKAHPMRTKPIRKTQTKNEYIDDSYEPMTQSKVDVYNSSERACSDKCWKMFSSDADDSHAWSSVEVLLVQKLSSSNSSACAIAAMMTGVTCRAIHAYLDRQQLKVSASNADEARDERTWGESISHHKSKSKRKQALSAAQFEKNIRNAQDFVPCDHKGECSEANCECFRNNQMCEKACACSRHCVNRFPGCKCSPGQCRTNQCTCFVALRECSPDVCLHCGASEAPAIEFDESRKHKSPSELGICHNMSIQRGRHKKIGMAFSTTHGWGAFARQKIKKGEFIYEYTGDLISQEEAERRGSIYDRMEMSFLFAANEDSVVDAMRKGNKSKFINHANAGPNCHCKIIRVDGEHRIGIWAKENIDVGEEMYFNYDYKGDLAPKWSQRRGDRKKNSSSAGNGGK